jgi:putative inorganic carbon (HCO3(-)) transporter
MTPIECIATERPASGLRELVKAHYRAAPYYLAFGSAVSIIFSIAISQILLGLGLLLLVIRREPFQFPPIKLPLALFFAATVLADLLSGDPLHGMPQIRKFFVFGIVALMFTTFHSAGQVMKVFLAWAGIGVLSAADGLAHVLTRRTQAIKLHWNTYDYFLDDRVRGFASHWMTFGAEQMIALLLLLSFLFFACPAKWRALACGCAIVLWASLMLSLTRCIFLLGVPAGVLYLLWILKRWTLALAPLLALISYTAAPFQVRERVWSVIAPHGDLDSNAHRSVTRRTGWEMVKAHPWFGLGPEQIQPQFSAYVPATIHRPLPAGWYGHLHNIYLQYAAERGIPALIFLLWTIGKMLLDFTAAVRNAAVKPESKFILHGAIAVIAAVLAEGFFEYNLGDSEVLTMFLVATTGAYVAIRAVAKPYS